MQRVLQYNRLAKNQQQQLPLYFDCSPYGEGRARKQGHRALLLSKYGSEPARFPRAFTITCGARFLASVAFLYGQLPVADFIYC